MVKGWESLKFWKTIWKDMQFLSDEYSPDKVFPRKEDWFKALELTPPEKVKVVILGQDPYPTKGYAHGLAFSVQPHVKPLPRSLYNIFKEYQADLGYPAPRNGDLRVWAERGVLLLNTILTVEEGKPLSHAGIGWEKLSYEILRSLATEAKVVCILLGKKAQEYEAACRPCPIIKAAHPSPLSTGFSGSRIFSRTNEELKKLGLEVDWKLS